MKATTAAHVLSKRGGAALLLMALIALSAMQTVRPAEATTANNYKIRPDLVIGNIQTVREDDYIGWQQFTQTITVRNTTETEPESHEVWGGPAYPVTVQITNSVGAVYDVSATSGFTCTSGLGRATCTGGHIPKGGSATITATIRFQDVNCPPYANWSNTIVADPANRVLERDETNNSKVYTRSCF